MPLPFFLILGAFSSVFICADLISCFFVSSSAFAVGPDMSALMSAIDFNSSIVSVLSIAGAIAVCWVAVDGAYMVLDMIRYRK